jgi:hypothetical protein
VIAQPETTRYQAIRAQINYLRSPLRKDGPSRYEAEEAILSLEKEADALGEQLYWDGAERAEKNFNQYL